MRHWKEGEGEQMFEHRSLSVANMIFYEHCAKHDVFVPPDLRKRIRLKHSTVAGQVVFICNVIGYRREQSWLPVLSA